MEFINVSKFKSRLIIERPVYFSKDLMSLLDEKKSEVDCHIYSVLLSIPLGIWKQRIEEHAANIVIFFVKDLILSTDQILVFAARLNNEPCIICIKDVEIINFRPVDVITNDMPIVIGDPIFKSFTKKYETLMYSPFLEKDYISLKTFFDEEQAAFILEDFERSCQGSLN